jgi:hypothetical protein
MRRMLVSFERILRRLLTASCDSVIGEMVKDERQSVGW